MGIFGLLKEVKNFKTHDHISISSDGVMSTTSAHYAKSEKVKAAAKAIAESMDKNKATA